MLKGLFFKMCTPFGISKHRLFGFIFTAHVSDIYVPDFPSLSLNVKYSRKISKLRAR